MMTPSVRRSKRTLFTETQQPKRVKKDIHTKIDAIIQKMLESPGRLGARHLVLKEWFTVKNLPVPEILLDVPMTDATQIPLEGDTLLHLAVKLRSVALIKLLIKSGEDPNFQNSYGMTVYQTAVESTCKKKYDQILSIIPPRIQNMNFQNGNAMQFMLHFSEFWKYVDLNAQNDLGNTFLHQFYSTNHSFHNQHILRNAGFEVFARLNPNLTLVNKKGYTCYELAAKNYFREDFPKMMAYMHEKGQVVKLLAGIVTPESPDYGMRSRMVTYLEKQDSLPFPTLIMNQILGYLNYRPTEGLSEFGCFASLNRASQAHAQTAVRERAIEYGMPPDSARDPQSYLRCLMDRVYKCRNKLPIEIILPPFDFDHEITLRRLQRISSRHLMIFVTKLNIYNHQNEPLRNILFSKNFRGIKSVHESIFGCRALRIAAYFQDFKLAKLLIEHGAKPNTNLSIVVVNFPLNHNYPLAWAAQSGSVEIAELYLNNGANVNEFDIQSGPALAFATGYGKSSDYVRNVNMVKLLLSRGADPKILTRDGAMPMHYAAKLGLTDIIAALLDHDPTLVNQRDTRGGTPLAWACGYGLLNGEYVNEPNMEVIQLLLNRNADPTLATVDALTPAQLAANHGFQPIADLITNFQGG